MNRAINDSLARQTSMDDDVLRRAITTSFSGNSPTYRLAPTMEIEGETTPVPLGKAALGLDHHGFIADQEAGLVRAIIYAANATRFPKASESSGKPVDALALRLGSLNSTENFKNIHVIKNRETATRLLGTAAAQAYTEDALKEKNCPRLMQPLLAKALNTPIAATIKKASLSF